MTTPSRYKLVLIAIVLALLAGVAAARTPQVAPSPSDAPVVAPASPSSPAAQNAEPTSIPMVQAVPSAPSTPPELPQGTPPPTSQRTAAAPTIQPMTPAPATLRPVPVVPGPVVTENPRPSIPVMPPTTATPSNDVHAIAPEPGLPGYPLPPVHE